MNDSVAKQREQEDAVTRAMRAIAQYRTAVISKLADEGLTLNDVEDSKSPLHGATPDTLEKYRNIFWHIQTTDAALGDTLKIMSKTAQLEKDEIRCYNCGARIAKEATSCVVCGWTWMGGSV
jgi:ribosomal protein L40E